MDEFLIDYLLSGKAWLLIGSGPSLEMGYPSWGKLAEISVSTAEKETISKEVNKCKSLLGIKDYPKVFAQVEKILGIKRLMQILKENLRPTNNNSEIYDIISKWPIPVYLTTNWDDEIAKHLVKLGVYYPSYLNSEDNLWGKMDLMDTKVR
jgi:hypothetical protein